MRERIGLFGGTFNPVHIGHLRAAEEIKELLLLDKIIFIPASIHPLKKNKDMLEADIRFKMLNLAVSDNPDFEVSKIELERKGTSYTIDTLRYFSRMFKNKDFYFIVGNENLARIGEWKEFRDLFSYSNFAVINRPGIKAASSKSVLPASIRKTFKLVKKDREKITYQHSSGNKLIFLKIRGIRISSTRVRQLIKNRKSVKYIIPVKLNSYILKNNLYIGE